MKSYVVRRYYPCHKQIIYSSTDGGTGNILLSLENFEMMWDRGSVGVGGGGGTVVDPNASRMPLSRFTQNVLGADNPAKELIEKRKSEAAVFVQNKNF